MLRAMRMGQRIPACRVKYPPAPIGRWAYGLCTAVWHAGRSPVPHHTDRRIVFTARRNGASIAFDGAGSLRRDATVLLKQMSPGAYDDRFEYEMARSIVRVTEATGIGPTEEPAHALGRLPLRRQRRIHSNAGRTCSGPRRNAAGGGQGQLDMRAMVFSRSAFETVQDCTPPGRYICGAQWGPINARLLREFCWRPKAPVRDSGNMGVRKALI